jgi:ABC-2 type transport system permease protein
MMAALHIFWREFKSYFFSPIGYFVMLCFLLFNGFIFWLVLSFSAQRPETPASMMPLTLLMRDFFFMLTAAGFIPIITMRLFSEEKRTGTMELLLTAPVTDLQVVIGKFFAAWFFFLSLWIPTFLYLGILVMNVDSTSAIDLGEVWGSYIGVAVMSFAFVAIGAMFSSFTKNTMLAFILTFSFLVILFFLGYASDQLPQGVIADVVSYVGAQQYMENFARGLIEIKALVYFLSMAFVALLITVNSLEARKWR